MKERKITEKPVVDEHEIKSNVEREWAKREQHMLGRLTGWWSCHRMSAYLIMQFRICVRDFMTIIQPNYNKWRHLRGSQSAWESLSNHTLINTLW